MFGYVIGLNTRSQVCCLSFTRALFPPYMGILSSLARRFGFIRVLFPEKYTLFCLIAGLFHHAHTVLASQVGDFSFMHALFHRNRTVFGFLAGLFHHAHAVLASHTRDFSPVYGLFCCEVQFILKKSSLFFMDLFFIVNQLVMRIFWVGYVRLLCFLIRMCSLFSHFSGISRLFSWSPFAWPEKPVL